jgi:hypothetical protein
MAINLGQGAVPAEDLHRQPRLMDEPLWETVQHHACGSLGLKPDLEPAFAGVRD